MKRIRLIVLLCLFPLLLQPAADFSASFAAANRLYEQGRFAEALAAYRLLEPGVVNWKLYFNIGNCLFRLRQLPMAKVYYLRALKYRPLEPSVERNLAVVDHALGENPASGADFFARLRLKLAAVIGRDLLAALVLLAVVAVNVWIFLLLVRGRRKGLLYGFAFTLAAALLLIAYQVYRGHELQRRDRGVIVRENAVLTSGPGEGNTVLAKVGPGLSVQIVDRNRNWVQVTGGGQVAGWIEEEYLVVI